MIISAMGHDLERDLIPFMTNVMNATLHMIGVGDGRSESEEWENVPFSCSTEN